MPTVDEIKAAARGREIEIFEHVLSPKLCDGDHHPCPMCGGKDRFRFDRVKLFAYCNQCFNSDNRDYWQAVKHFGGAATFTDAIRIIADILGLSGTHAKSNRKPTCKPTATYDYRNESGALLFQVCRYADGSGKTFRQRKPNGKGWSWSVKGVQIIPYRLPEILKKPTAPVCVVEGEKDADSLAELGIPATCNSGGAGKWKPEHSAFLRGRNVIILPDNDETGAEHAQQVAVSLHGIAESVKLVELPDLPLKGDVSDWLASGGTREQLIDLIKKTPSWTPEEIPWPEIERFDQSNLPAFPTEVLPPILRKYVEAESVATQTPPDLAGLLTLAVCSAAIARRVEVIPRTGWREPVNLFVAVLLEPGNRKSAVFSDCVGPLREVERELIEESRPSISRQQSIRRQDETRLKKLEKLAAEKNDDQARHEAMELSAELSQSTEPALPRLIVDDATAEKLGMVLAEQAGRIASMSPEGGVFDLMAGLYSKSGIPQFGVYLNGHSGDDLTTDRVSRKSVYVERPALTCAFTIQPQVIEGLAEQSAFRGRGLLARFLYAFPVSWIGSRKIAAPPMPASVKESYRGKVRELCFQTEKKVTLSLNASAERLLIDWETEIESMLADGGDLEILRDWGSKLVGATLRLAAVMHCVQHGLIGEMDAPILSNAIEVARYLIPHAEAVLSQMSATSNREVDDAQYVLRWIVRHKKTEFSKRDAQQHGKRRFPKADDIDSALVELTRRGYIRQRSEENSGPGRPPSPTFEINPSLGESERTEKRSQYSQNVPRKVEHYISENIENTFQQFESQNRVEETI